MFHKELFGEGSVLLLPDVVLLLVTGWSFLVWGLRRGVCLSTWCVYIHGKGVIAEGGNENNSKRNNKRV